jgi:hypothetical protein
MDSSERVGVGPSPPGEVRFLAIDHRWEVLGLPSSDQVLSVEVEHRPFELQEELEAVGDAAGEDRWIAGAESERRRRVAGREDSASRGVRRFTDAP